MKIFGEAYEVRAEVATIGGLSAHAGQDFLTEYALASRDKLQEIYLVHGEPGPAAALRAHLGEAGLTRVQYPKQGSITIV